MLFLCGPGEKVVGNFVVSAETGLFLQKRLFMMWGRDSAVHFFIFVQFFVHCVLFVHFCIFCSSETWTEKLGCVWGLGWGPMARSLETWMSCK